MFASRRQLEVGRLLATCLLVGACTGSSESSDILPASTTAVVEDDLTDTTTENAEPTSTVPSMVVAEDGAADVEPLRPEGDPLPTTDVPSSDASAYISRVAMSSRSIEVTWSDEDGADAYHIHRVVRISDDKPEAQAMTSENMIHVADDLGRFVDEGVEPGTQYWYGVRALSPDGSLVAHGWHRADAVDDDEPPAVVPDLEVDVDGGQALVTWSIPDENYELHGYRILRGVDGNVPEQIAITWQIDQTSFLDDELPTVGEIVYQVVAFDFHWNDSLPGSVTVDQQ